MFDFFPLFFFSLLISSSPGPYLHLIPSPITIGHLPSPSATALATFHHRGHLQLPFEKSPPNATTPKPIACGPVSLVRPTPHAPPPVLVLARLPVTSSTAAGHHRTTQTPMASSLPSGEPHCRTLPLYRRRSRSCVHHHQLDAGRRYPASHRSTPINHAQPSHRTVPSLQPGTDLLRDRR